MSVTRLTEIRGGFPAEGRRDLVNWLRSWADVLEADDNVRTLVLLVEDESGELFRVSKSTADLDRARLVGLLYGLAHLVIDGNGHHPSKD